MTRSSKARKSSSHPVPRVSRSSADNASVPPQALRTGRRFQGKGHSSLGASVCRGPRCSRNPSSCSEPSRKGAAGSGSSIPASVHCGAPGHHGHRLKGQAGKTPPKQHRLKTPQNPTSSRARKKLRDRLQKGEDLPEPQVASSSCGLVLPQHLLFFFFALPRRALRGWRGEGANLLCCCHQNNSGEQPLGAAPASPRQWESHQRVPALCFCLGPLLHLQPVSSRFEGDTIDVIGQGNELFVQLYFSCPGENHSGRRQSEEQWISVAVGTVCHLIALGYSFLMIRISVLVTLGEGEKTWSSFPPSPRTSLRNCSPQNSFPSLAQHSICAH